MEFALKPAVQDTATSEPLRDVRGAVTLENVSFQYDDGTPALSNVSLRIEPGERIAIVGRNGAGKSTLARMLLRFYDPQEGTIRVDDRDIRNVTLASLRRGIGWVHQDTVLFGMTIAENIALGDPDADDESIRAVARRVSADEFIEKLPDRYETKLGQNGSRLSGGERQRIALARALLPNPSILLLDEPATGQDPLSRELVEKSWMSSENRATTIVICHRLHDMDRFDNIIVLKDGEICERGTHAQLLDRGAEYASMLGAGEDREATSKSDGCVKC